MKNSNKKKKMHKKNNIKIKIIGLKETLNKYLVYMIKNRKIKNMKIKNKKNKSL
jgi:hypothetical protein